MSDSLCLYGIQHGTQQYNIIHLAFEPPTLTWLIIQQQSIQFNTVHLRGIWTTIFGQLSCTRRLLPHATVRMKPVDKLSGTGRFIGNFWDVNYVYHHIRKQAGGVHGCEMSDFQQVGHAVRSEHSLKQVGHQKTAECCCSALSVFYFVLQTDACQQHDRSIWIPGASSLL